MPYIRCYDIPTDNLFQREITEAEAEEIRRTDERFPKWLRAVIDDQPFADIGFLPVDVSSR